MDFDGEYSTDSDDDDYVPSAEESDDHEIHDDVSSAEENAVVAAGSEKGPKKTEKRRKKTPVTNSKRRGGIKLDGDDNPDEKSDTDVDEPVVVAKDESVAEGDDKVRSDALWSDFLKDTKVSPQSKQVSTDNEKSEKPLPTIESNGTSEKVKVTKLYTFAGEEVVVKEFIDSSNSPEQEMVQDNCVVEKTAANSLPKPSPSTAQNKGKGLNNILGKLTGKGNKLSTLEKSKLDWHEFKEEEGIDDELQNFNKGKDGYLERQAFLQRTDLRQFEIERSLRQFNRSNKR